MLLCPAILPASSSGLFLINQVGFCLIHFTTSTLAIMVWFIPVKKNISFMIAL
jgi:hypothetical protein